MIELLAPVGSYDALVAAIASGAEAVYLGGKQFGARAYADNFDNNQLEEVVRLAHLNGVRVYVTVNTLVDNSEVDALINFLIHLNNIGVDGIIVQDIGVMYLAGRVVPELPVHASTQMTVHNLDGVEFLVSHGVKRVVLARELSLEEIKNICRKTKAEIEIFIHGALCVSYSGQCLMSSLIGGRSGNRGRCAQPCRLPYTLVDENGVDLLGDTDCGEYLLSPKDLNTLNLLPKLVDAGVASLKIEGRMKRPEYVAVVVSTYRQALDGYLTKLSYRVEENHHRNLAQIFNRDFTTGYLEKKQGRNMISDRRPNNRGVKIGRVINYDIKNKIVTVRLYERLNQGDILEFWVKVGGRVSVQVDWMRVGNKKVASAEPGELVSFPVQTFVGQNDRIFKVYDVRLMDYARSFIKNPIPRRVPVNAYIEAAEGKPLVVTFKDIDGYEGKASTDFVAQKAINRALTKDTLRAQIDRLGNTVFKLNMLECNIEDGIMVPLSEINEARRKAIEDLEEKRLQRFSRTRVSISDLGEKNLFRLKKSVENKVKTPLLVVNVDTVTKVAIAVEQGADIVMFGGESFSNRMYTANDYLNAVELVRSRGRKIILNTPRIVRDGQKGELVSNLKLFLELKPDYVGVANIGTLSILTDIANIPVHADYPLNIYNSWAVEFLYRQGVNSMTLSPELNFGQIEDILRYSAGEVSLECIIHGRLTLMVSEYCLLGSYIGGGPDRCKRPCAVGKFWLRDRMQEKFPVVTDQYCRMHILNAKELSMLPHVSKFKQLGIERVRIEGKYTSEHDLTSVVKAYRSLLDDKDMSKEHYDYDSIEHKDITRGHFFRGVL